MIDMLSSKTGVPQMSIFPILNASTEAVVTIEVCSLLAVETVRVMFVTDTAQMQIMALTLFERALLNCESFYRQIADDDDDDGGRIHNGPRGTRPTVA